MLFKEGTNKTIIVNSVVLYTRLIITSVCGFFTTRFALQALGIDDYGLYSVLGGIIAFMDVANAVMISTTTRFMTVALAKGNESDINEQMNINLHIHIFTSLFSLLLALTIGYWYIYNHLNYDGNIRNAIFVYSISVISGAVSMIGVPYQGVITAKELFIVTSLPDIFSAILKLGVSWILVFYFNNKLIVFSAAQAFCTVYPAVAYAFYCYKHYPSIVKLSKVKDKGKYKEVLKFSGWTLYGTAACMAKSQGAAIVVNLFFTTAMNAALGIANMLSSLINKFARNAVQPMFPQITKSYSAGNIERSTQLLCMTVKVSFVTTLFFSSPFLIDTEWILGLWLKEVPPMAVLFTKLLVIDLLVSSLDHGIGTIIKADGNIWAYEFFGNSLRFISVIVSFYFLKKGAPAESILYVFIVTSFIVVLVSQIILHKITKIENIILIKKSYLPSSMVALFFFPVLFYKVSYISYVNIIVGVSYLVFIIWMVGLNNQERNYIRKITTSFILRLKDFIICANK